MERPPTRLFIAIELDEAMRRALHEPVASVEAPTWRPVSIDNLHLTLKFIGQTPADAVDAIASTLAAWVADCHAFTLRSTGDVVPLPSPEKPRLLAAEVERSRELSLLAETVDLACQSLDIPPEDRTFRPHITLGRFKFKGRPPRGFRPPRIRVGESATQVGNVTLFASHLRPTGPVYDPLARPKLTEPPKSG